MTRQEAEEVAQRATRSFRAADEMTDLDCDKARLLNDMAFSRRNRIESAGFQTKTLYDGTVVVV